MSRVIQASRSWGEKFRSWGLWLALIIGTFLTGAPVVFGMANEVSSTTLANDEATEWISDKTLRVAFFHLATYQFAEKHKLPEGQGRVFKIPRYEHLYLPQNPLTQGVTPGNTSMTINEVHCTAEQWGAVITIYDVPILTTKHNLLRKGIEGLGVQAAKTFERENQRAMLGGTNVQLANSKASRSLLVSTDTLTSREIRAAVANLRNNGATDWTRTETNTSSAYIEKALSFGGGTKKAMPGLEGQAKAGFIGIVDPYVEADLGGDATFVNAAAYQNIRALYLGEIGNWLGANWIRSNYMPQLTLLSSPVCADATLTVATGLTAVAHDLTVTRVSKNYGIEEAISANIDVTVTNNGISVALPTAAAYMYRIYLGLDGATKYLVPSVGTTLTAAAEDLTGPCYEGNQTVYLYTLPTTGDTSPVAPASGVTVHLVWIFGAEAFGAVELQALEATLTPNEASDSDPLKQRRKIGWKVFYKCVVQNNNFLRRIEVGSAFA